MTFSVLICTYNRPQLLAQCLDALVYRTVEKPNEIVIVNGGDARTDTIVSSLQSPIPVSLITTQNKNLASSRNVGLPHCTGDIVAMTDDDAEVFPDWVTEMKRAHVEHPEAGVIGGAVIGADTSSLVSRIADTVTFPRFEIGRAVRTVPGVNVSYKREVIEQVGLQDETLFRGEDVDYNWRAQKLGWSVWYDPRVRVLHHHRPTLRAFLNQHYMYGRAYYLVRKKHPDMYCVYPHRLARGKDVLKAVNFFAAAVYEPLQSAGRMERASDKILAYPILFANQVAWRGGMIREKLRAM
jgi:GT2 family glycosyltransferase